MKTIRHADLPQLTALDLQHILLMKKLRALPTVRSAAEPRVWRAGPPWECFELRNSALAFGVRSRRASVLDAVFRRSRLATTFPYFLHRYHADLLSAAFAVEGFAQLEHCGRFSLAGAAHSYLEVEAGDGVLDLVLLRCPDAPLHGTVEPPQHNEEMFRFLKKRTIDLLFSCGRASVSLSDFRQLAAGDVVLLGPHESGVRKLQVNLFLSHSPIAIGIGIMEGPIVEISSMSDAPDEEGNSPEGEAGSPRLFGLDMLEIDLTFVVARKRMKVRDLMRLERGALIDLDAVVDDDAPVAVEILMQNAIVGTGTLVCAGDRLAVMIETLLPRKAEL